MSNVIEEQEKVAKDVQRIIDIFKSSKGQVRPHFIITGPSGSGKSHIMQKLGASIYVIHVIPRIKPHFLFSSSINCSVIISFCMSEMAFSCIEIILYSPSLTFFKNRFNSCTAVSS